jgi:hypothetical protein
MLLVPATLNLPLLVDESAAISWPMLPEVISQFRMTGHLGSLYGRCRPVVIMGAIDRRMIQFAYATGCTLMVELNGWDVLRDHIDNLLGCLLGLRLNLHLLC